MGSGYFPFYRNDPEAKKLMEAISLIKEVRDSVWDEVYMGSDGQFDNAASDGGYLRQLAIATALIEECFEKEKKERPEDKLIEDIKVLVLRLLGEDESTFAPETYEVMKRWKDKVLP